jgi:hypothetical protein
MEKCRGHRIVLAIVVVGTLLPAAGCFIWNSEVDYGDKGAPLSGSTLKKVECGKTTKAWVLATLGKPSQESTTEGGVELLTYKYSKSQDSNVVMPFLIVNDEKKQEQTVFFEVKDGVVQKYWVENVKR